MKWGAIFNKSEKIPSIKENRLVKIEALLRNDTWISDAYNCISVLDSNLYSPLEKARYRDFLISALSEEMAGFYTYRAYSEDGSSLLSLVEMPLFIAKTAISETFTSESKHIIVLPDMPKRLVQAIQDIDEKGYLSEEEIATGTLYKELNLVITYNHRHHVAAAISRECSDNILFHGPVLSQEIAASPICATSDFHFADKEGNIIKEHSDPRLVLCCLLVEQAIAFKSGNMNHQIKNSII